MSKFFNKRPNRSDAYQWVLLETPCSSDFMAAQEDHKIPSDNSIEVQEWLYDLDDDLRIEFWKIVDTRLTPRQTEIIHMYVEGYTQMEIAKRLNVNQSSVTKSLYGNVDYKNGKKVYGGSRKKLNKMIVAHDKIKGIMAQMYQRIDNEKCFFYHTFKRCFNTSIEFEAEMKRLAVETPNVPS